MPYIKSEGMTLVSSFLQESVVHICQGGFVACIRIQLYLLNPDVFSKGKPNHVQVIATVAESAGQLNPNCMKQETDQN